jgi:hypothetical protein
LQFEASEQIVHKTLSQKKPSQKRALGVDPEFKPQYHKEQGYKGMPGTRASTGGVRLGLGGAGSWHAWGGVCFPVNWKGNRPARVQLECTRPWVPSPAPQ